MRKGNWRIMAASTGSSQVSLRRALAETICHCDLIDSVDVEHALGSRLIALMHAVDPQITGLALRIGPSSLPDSHRRGPGLDVMQTALAITRLLPQVVQVSHRDRSQALVFRLAVVLILAFENPPRGRPA